MSASDRDEPNDMGFFDFLDRISYRPPNIIFIILGFVLVVWGWPNIYAGPQNSFHFGNFGVGMLGAILVLVSILIEVNVRSGKWKPKDSS